ncbi:MAG: hypothetical protein ABR968_14870 [Bacteroidales bacterium]
MKCRYTLAHLPVAAFGGWASPTTGKRANLPTHTIMLFYFME